MAVCVRLDRWLVRRRMSLVELADRIGVTVADLGVLKAGSARAIRLSTLEALCRELGCQPGDLLEYHPQGDPDRGDQDGGAQA